MFPPHLTRTHTPATQILNTVGAGSGYANMPRDTGDDGQTQQGKLQHRCGASRHITSHHITLHYIAHRFKFGRIFTEAATQEDVFDAVGMPICDRSCYGHPL